MKTQHTTPANISVWMPLRIGDLRRETNAYPLEFQAMYVNLLMAAWEHGGQLPDDEKQLRRLSGADASQWREHRQDLANLFVPIHGTWTHNAIRVELVKGQKIRDERIAAGRNGGINRWAKARNNAKAITDALMVQITKDGGAY